ncbi:MAG: hypothetical protein AABX54_05705 [Nanoarchaeota archaeon]
MKNKIVNEKNLVKAEGMIVNLKQKHTTEPSYLFCDKVWYMHDKDPNDKEFFDHHLMFYNKGDLIFKIWLPNKNKDKEFRDIHEVLKSVGMQIRVPPYIENIKEDIRALKKSRKKFANRLTEKGKKNYKKGIEKREKILETIKQIKFKNKHGRDM